VGLNSHAVLFDLFDIIYKKLFIVRLER